jgi:peroxiredoxin
MRRFILQPATRVVRRLTLLLLTATTLPLAVRPGGAQQPLPLGPAEGRDLAPTEIARVAIGASAPDFTLARHGGGTVTLSQFRGKKNVVLVFYRGHWCPYCITQLREMRTLLSGELKRDTELLVVSIDGEKETNMALARIGTDGVAPDFTFLSDPDHAVIARYGVLNPSGSRRGIPHPATFVIDQGGVVRWRDVQTDYKIRPTNSAILSAVTALAPR